MFLLFIVRHNWPSTQVVHYRLQALLHMQVTSAQPHHKSTLMTKLLVMDGAC